MTLGEDVSKILIFFCVIFNYSVCRSTERENGAKLRGIKEQSQRSPHSTYKTEDDLSVTFHEVLCKCQRGILNLFRI